MAGFQVIIPHQQMFTAVTPTHPMVVDFTSSVWMQCNHNQSAKPLTG